MYKVLNKKEIQLFIQRYFEYWGSDIKKVSVISYDEVDEYLVNDHYLFLVVNKKVLA